MMANLPSARAGAQNLMSFLARVVCPTRYAQTSYSQASCLKLLHERVITPYVQGIKVEANALICVVDECEMDPTGNT